MRSTFHERFQGRMHYVGRTGTLTDSTHPLTDTGRNVLKSDTNPTFSQFSDDFNSHFQPSKRTGSAGTYSSWSRPRDQQSQDGTSVASYCDIRNSDFQPSFASHGFRSSINDSSLALGNTSSHQRASSSTLQFSESETVAPFDIIGKKPTAKDLLKELENKTANRRNHPTDFRQSPKMKPQRPNYDASIISNVYKPSQFEPQTYSRNAYSSLAQVQSQSYSAGYGTRSASSYPYPTQNSVHAPTFHSLSPRSFQSHSSAVSPVLCSTSQSTLYSIQNPGSYQPKALYYESSNPNFNSRTDDPYSVNSSFQSHPPKQLPNSERKSNEVSKISRKPRVPRLSGKRRIRKPNKDREEKMQKKKPSKPYRPIYKLKDLKALQKPELGSLGWVETEETKIQRERRRKQSTYGMEITHKNMKKKYKKIVEKPKVRYKSKFEKAKEFAKKVPKPKPKKEVILFKTKDDRLHKTTLEKLEENHEFHKEQVAKLKRELKEFY